MNFLKSTKTKQILKTVLVTTLYITAFTMISDDLLFGIAVGTALGVVLTDNNKTCCK